MDVVMLVMMAEWALDVLAFGLKSIWGLVTIVSLISLIVVISHLLPRREY